MQENAINTSFLDDGGECGELIRSINWSATPVGPVSQWPQILKTTLGVILHTKFPMFLFWGPELVCFYNDAYRPSLGNNGKHPDAMGQLGADCWPEIWAFIKPLIDKALKGEASWYEDQLLPIYRNGQMEDVYWTFSYSPVINEIGKPAGVFVTCTETTEKVQSLKILEENRKELEFAIDAAELGTWEYNPKTGYISANERLKNWFGLPVGAEFSLASALNIIIEKDRERVVAAIEKALQRSSGGKYDINYTIVNPITKVERIIRARGKAFFNDDEDIAYRFNGTLQDITDDSIARRLLVDSEENFRAMILQAPVAMCVLKGPEYVVEIANGPIYELWGKTAEQTLNKPLFEGLPEVKGQGLEELLKNVLTTGEKFLASERAVALPRNGSLEVLYIDFVYAPFKNGDSIDGIIVVATDVTAQVVSRQKIQDAEERARLAMDAVEMGTYDLDFATSKIITSPRFNQIFGLNQSVAHRDYVSVIHPDDYGIRRIAYEAALKTGYLKYIARIIWPDRSIRWMRAAGKIIFDDNGNPLRLLGTVIDITESKVAEDELIEINQRLELALEAGRLGSYVLDIGNRGIECNKQFKADFGLKGREHFTFDDLISTIIPVSRDRVRGAVALAIKNKTDYNEEFQVIWPDNTVRWIRASGKIKYNEGGSPAIIIGVSFDITDHKNLQQQKDDFISIASHELKTPVTSIKAYTQVLEKMLKQTGHEREAGMITKMDAQVNRLTSLIGDLLDVTKINSGKLQFNDQDFLFGELVEEVVEDLQRTTEKHVLINNFNYKGMVCADRDRIAQVVSNLISNAIKYSPQPGNIIIRSSLKDNEIQVCIEDFGVGISEEKQDLVFEQFYRVSGNKQHTFPGLGLGLYISSEIVKREGGRIWVTSVENKGSTFCFALPVKYD